MQLTAVEFPSNLHFSGLGHHRDLDHVVWVTKVMQVIWCESRR